MHGCTLRTGFPAAPPSTAVLLAHDARTMQTPATPALPTGTAPTGAPSEAPVLRGLPLLGNLPALRRNPIEVFERAAAVGPDVVRIPVGPSNVFLVRRPEHVRYVLLEQQKRFSKQTRGYHALRLVLGNGLVTSEGDFWLRQRRLSQPAFHRQRIGQFAQKMVTLTQEMLERWDAQPAGAVVDVAQEMMELTLRIVGWTLLSTEVGGDKAVVSQNLTDMLHEVIQRTTALFAPPLALPTRQNLIIRRARRNLDGVVLRIIEARRRSGASGEDLLGLLMSARDEDTQEAMTDAQLRDEVMTLFLAGHETTANALTWTFHLLSDHPEVRARMETEVDEALCGRAPEPQDLSRLPYTLAVVQESMRLYPPVWLLMRRAERDDVIGGYRIPTGSFVAVPPFTLHRDERLFPNPLTFDPERFLGERAQSIPRYGYLPFSTGPRICIGNNFALMEAQLILALVAQRYRPWRVPEQKVELDPSITLRPRHGMRMRLLPR